MNFIDCLKSSFKNIFHNKMRSFLTMLGIIVGISSVILIVALGRGSTEQITGQFDKMGAKTLNISANLENAFNSDLLTHDDLKAVLDSSKEIVAVSPQDQVAGTVQLNDDTNNRRTAYLFFVNHEFYNIGGIDLLNGRFFTNSEYQDGKLYTVIDSLTCEKLFKTKEVIGKNIKVNYGGAGKTLTIIGVFDIDPFFAGVGTNVADTVGVPAFVFIPHTLEPLFGMQTKTINKISAILKDDSKTNDIADNIVKILAIRHNNLGRQVYKIERASTQINKYDNVINIVTALIVSVAGISLLVGGIGVMNIMLVSVTERTREIGTRKALGASTVDIMSQFLVESIIICLTGGIVGVSIGVIISLLVSKLTGLKSSPNLNVIFISLLFSSLIGMFFGIYPAKKAATLNPIDALRFD